MMEPTAVTDALAALSHPARLSLFRALVVAGEPGLTPGVLIESLRLPAATLSFHLKELVRTGLATQQRAGRHLIYRAGYDRMQSLIEYLTANCCQGVPCLEPITHSAECC